MKTNILLFLVFGVFLFACKKDEKADVGKGDLFVTILYMNGNMPSPIRGVKITTVPATQEATTDQNGNVLFRDLTAISYDVCAEYPGFAKVKAAVTIVKNNTQEIYMTIHSGNELGLMPTIDVISPTYPATFALNDNVVFWLNVRDNDTPFQDLKVTISSDLDGLLVDSHPDLNNTVRFETPTLSSGIHQITVKATDKDKNITTKTFTLSTQMPGNIVLDTAYVSNGNIQINWRKYAKGDFDKYEIFRTTDPATAGQLVTTIRNVTTLSYIDKTAPIVNALWYYIRVSNSSFNSVNSNKVKVNSPSGRIFPYSITDAAHNPVKPIIYLVDYYSNSLKAINYETGTEIKSVTIQGYPGKIDVGDNGLGIDASGNNVDVFLPSSNGNVYVYDGNTLNLIKTIVTGENNKSVANSGHGYIVITSGSQWDKPERSFSIATGLPISSMAAGYMGDFIRFVPNNDKLFAITDGLSTSLLGYYELNASGVFNLFVKDTYFGKYPCDPRIFKMSPNGQFFVTSSSGAVYYTTSTKNFKGFIPRGALSFSDFEFSKDGNTIYGATADRTSIQIIKYPDLTRDNEYITKGYPHYIFNFNGYLISISQVDLNTISYAVEKIKID